ncbi:hypothetical protein [Geomicrobium sediminis]|uniref:DUF3953 domain-containing protein n=1 Tax=Geomicrobium sediminis TaxID=1347788 RepID=A0ABS2P6L5_9BACL|nr:hypothetical protein [Geomicrobium sediminis]MBM7631050.1 hypothetical protein [Geomicrobium sediminis]
MQRDVNKIITTVSYTLFFVFWVASFLSLVFTNSMGYFYLIGFLFFFSGLTIVEIRKGTKKLSIFYGAFFIIFLLLGILEFFVY